MITRPPTPYNVHEIQVSMRNADRYELDLSGGSLKEAVALSSLCEVLVTDHGLTLALWGLRDDPKYPGVASIWMLCSRYVEHYPTQFLRACAPLVERAHERYHALICATWRGNSLHHRWLEWLGFTAHAVEPKTELIPYTHVLPTRNPAADDGRLGGWRSGTEVRV